MRHSLVKTLDEQLAVYDAAYANANSTNQQAAEQLALIKLVLPDLAALNASAYAALAVAESKLSMTYQQLRLAISTSDAVPATVIEHTESGRTIAECVIPAGDGGQYSTTLVRGAVTPRGEYPTSAITVAHPAVDVRKPGGDISVYTGRKGGVLHRFALHSVTPSGGPIEGGTVVHLNGDGFEAPMTCRFLDTLPNGTSVVADVESPRSATCVSPSGGRGAVSVTLRPAGGCELKFDFHYYDSPSVLRVEPNIIPRFGRREVIVTATNLHYFTSLRNLRGAKDSELGPSDPNRAPPVAQLTIKVVNYFSNGTDRVLPAVYMGDEVGARESGTSSNNTNVTTVSDAEAKLRLLLPEETELPSGQHHLLLSLNGQNFVGATNFRGAIGRSCGFPPAPAPPTPPAPPPTGFFGNEPPTPPDAPPLPEDPCVAAAKALSIYKRSLDATGPYLRFASQPRSYQPPPPGGIRDTAKRSVEAVPTYLREEAGVLLQILEDADGGDERGAIATPNRRVAKLYVPIELFQPAGGVLTRTVFVTVQLFPYGKPLTSGGPAGTRECGEDTVCVALNRALGGLKQYGGNGVDSEVSAVKAAMPNEDYVPREYTLTWQAGEPYGVKTVELEILDDSIRESYGEVLECRITETVNADVTGTNDTARVVILDDDEPATFAAVGGSFAYRMPPWTIGSRSAFIPVERIRGHSKLPAKIAYQVKGGTATPYEHYTPRSGTLTFEPDVLHQESDVNSYRESVRQLVEVPLLWNKVQYQDVLTVGIELSPISHALVENLPDPVNHPDIVNGTGATYVVVQAALTIFGVAEDQCPPGTQRAVNAPPIIVRSPPPPPPNPPSPPAPPPPVPPLDSDSRAFSIQLLDGPAEDGGKLACFLTPDFHQLVFDYSCTVPYSMGDVVVRYQRNPRGFSFAEVLLDGMDAAESRTRRDGADRTIRRWHRKLAQTPATTSTTTNATDDAIGDDGNVIFLEEPDPLPLKVGKNTTIALTLISPSGRDRNMYKIRVKRLSPASALRLDALRISVDGGGMLSTNGTGVRLDDGKLAGEGLPCNPGFLVVDPEYEGPDLPFALLPKVRPDFVDYMFDGYNTPKGVAKYYQLVTMNSTYSTYVVKKYSDPMDTSTDLQLVVASLNAPPPPPSPPMPAAPPPGPFALVTAGVKATLDPSPPPPPPPRRPAEHQSLLQTINSCRANVLNTTVSRTTEFVRLHPTTLEGTILIVERGVPSLNEPLEIVYDSRVEGSISTELPAPPLAPTPPPPPDVPSEVDTSLFEPPPPTPSSPGPTVLTGIAAKPIRVAVGESTLFRLTLIAPDLQSRTSYQLIIRHEAAPPPPMAPNRPPTPPTPPPPPPNPPLPPYAPPNPPPVLPQDPKIGRKCRVCDAGYVSSGVDDLACVPCEVGKFSPIPGRSQCSTCKRGTFASRLASDRCEPCLRGTYAPEEGSSLCTVCAVNETTTSDGSEFCDLSAGIDVVVGEVYAVNVTFRVEILNVTHSMFKDANTTAGVAGDGDDVLRAIIRIDAAEKFNVSLTMVTVTGLLEDSLRSVISANITVLAVAELPPHPTPDEVESALESAGLNADAAVKHMQDDPDRFFRRTTKATGGKMKPYVQDQSSSASISRVLPDAPSNRPSSWTDNLPLPFYTSIGMLVAGVALAVALERLLKRIFGSSPLLLSTWSRVIYQYRIRRKARRRRRNVAAGLGRQDFMEVNADAVAEDLTERQREARQRRTRAGEGGASASATRFDGDDGDDELDEGEMRRPRVVTRR